MATLSKQGIEVERIHGLKYSLSLRSNGVIQAEEVAIQVGDILVAENVVTRTRRVITNGITVNESTDRRLIRD